jgi:nitroreductase
MNQSSRTSLSLFRNRQSVRSYLPDPVPRDALDRCVEAALLAPSANNGQPWYFVIAGDEKRKNSLAAAAGFGPLRANPFALQAPVIAAVFETPGHRPTRWGGMLLGRYFPLMDLGMAVENFCLQAAAEGLGTCILGLFSASRVRHVLQAPLNHRPRLLITVGRPASEEVRLKKRLPPERIHRYIEGSGITDVAGNR